MVIGFVSDKDLGSVLPLFPRDAGIISPGPRCRRALDEKVLKAKRGGTV
jgi:hypothetical protein